jgi:hypothetical protein
MTIMQTVTRQKDVLAFGKYKGHDIAWVLLLHPGYICWLDEKQIVKFPRRILEKAIKANEEQLSRDVNRHLMSRLRDEMDGWDGYLDE